MTTVSYAPTDLDVADRIADLDANGLIRYCRGAALINQCPQCGASVGLDCTEGEFEVPPHEPRERLIEKLETPARIAAYARLKLEAEWRQAEARARLDELNADPQYVAARDASWARQRATLASIDDEIREAGRHCAQVAVHAPGCRCAEDGTPVRPLHQPDRCVVVSLDEYRRRHPVLRPVRGADPGGVA